MQRVPRGSVAAVQEHTWGTARLSLERMECTASLSPGAHYSNNKLLGMFAKLTRCTTRPQSTGLWSRSRKPVRSQKG